MHDLPCRPVPVLVLVGLLAFFSSGDAAATVAALVTIDLGAGPANTFIPDVALGAGVDGHARGDAAAIYRPATLRAMRSVGLRPLTYRLRTELGIEAWHWNPRGHWSDSQNAQGYWISDDRPGTPILASFGYRLPRRGNTIDQAEDNGYSRLADGDLGTFWKSNPYLDRRYTGEDGHPQWLIADLGSKRPVDAIRIAWGTPYARRYTLQYWDGEDPDLPDALPEGQWRDFPDGDVVSGSGGDGMLRLAAEAIPVRYLRVLLKESSATAPPGATDPRDALGYAVREVAIGIVGLNGELHDAVRHAASRKGQTRFFVSSTDPWHRATDLDASVEQAGIDRVLSSGLTHGLPMLIPVGVLYDTPDNAAALLRYLQRRGHSVRGVELGEEPDGQYIAPEDYGALYLQTVDALRAVDATVALGGPSLQSIWDEPTMAWAGTSVTPDRPWLAGFLRYLEGHGRMADLGFLSFEWYPFDDVCAPTAPHLQQAPALLAEAMANLNQQGLPRDTPLLMTEYGYSAFATQAEVDLAGALFNADAVGTFLTQGGSAAYLYGYEPSNIESEPDAGCETWGNNALFLAGERRRIVARTATYHGARLLARQWAGDPTQAHRIYSARVDVGLADGSSPLSAYAVERPDGLWAVLLVNKDPTQDWTVTVQFAGTDPEAPVSLLGPADVYQFSAAQYQWRANGEYGRPQRSQSPRHTIRREAAPLQVRIPAWSLTVVRSGGPAAPPAATDLAVSLRTPTR